MRVALGVTLESRDGTTSKDARVVNGIVEVKGQGDLRVRPRPGNIDLGLVKAGTAQLLYYWNGVNVITGDYLSRAAISSLTSPTSTNLSPSTAGLQFSAQDTGSNALVPLMMIKNRTQAWTVDRAGAVSAVTYGGTMGLVEYAVTSITRASTVATATTLSDTGVDVGDTITIAGADQTEYNGAMVVTGVNAGSYTAERDIPISITRSSTTASAVSSTPHGLSSSTYTVGGANETAYNGAVSITVDDAYTFHYTVSVTGSGPDQSIPITITRSGTTATATSTSAHGLSDSTQVISGADQTEYNGSKSITVTGDNQFTYTVSVTAAIPATPATGSPSISSWFATESIDFNCVNAPSSATVTVNTPYGNSFANGDTFTTDSLWGWPGTHTVAGRTSSSFTFTITPGLGYAGTGPQIYRTPPTVSSITRSSSTATLTTTGTHKIQTKDSLTIAGCTQTQYNVTASATRASSNTVTYNVSYTAESPASPATGTITVVGKSPTSPATGPVYIVDPAVTVNPTFTYTVSGTPATPATGTITATTNGGTVPGIPYIDGYFFVMDLNGVMWASDPDDPTSWPALNFLSAQNINGAGKALNRSGSYLIAFKEWSTEYFYDPRNTTVGFPFLPVDNGFTEIGCASGTSVVDVEGALCWMSQTKQEGRSVHMMQGLQSTKISTPDVDRILNKDDLATVHAFGLKLDGHTLYLLTLVTSNVTLVYDITSSQIAGFPVWTQWSSTSITALPTISSITRAGQVATVTTATAHGLSDGDPVLQSGIDQTEYNGYFQISYISPTSYSVIVNGSPTTPATGTMIMATLAETYFKSTKYADCAGYNVMLNESDGHAALISSTTHQDSLYPINVDCRGVILDGGNTNLKSMSQIVVISDVVADPLAKYVAVRWSDDDYTTWSPYRFIDLSTDQPLTNKAGAFRRRAMQMRYVLNGNPTFSALEMDIS